MNGAIGEVLPLALGVAISPIPIIAAILMLLSSRAKVTSTGFLIGWVVGIALAVTVFALLSAAVSDAADETAKPVRGTIQLLLGAGLILLAIRQWRSRPRDGRQAELPRWMKAIDTVSFPFAAGLGFALAALNPKNLIMAAGAGTAIGAHTLDGTGTALVIAVYTLLAASTVLIPVVGYLLAAERMRGALDALHTWLSKENAVIMAVLLLVIGITMIGKGVGSF